MGTLNTYAMLAEILGATTIIFGTLFAVFQFREHKKQLKVEAAADMCRKFAEPDIGRAVTLVKRLPDNISLAELQSMDIEYEEAAQVIAMTFEMMGLLIHKNVASFELIQQLTGGLLLMMWRKTNIWIKETREVESNPRFGEWGEWLAVRLETCEKDMVPAYIAHAEN